MQTHVTRKPRGRTRRGHSRDMVNRQGKSPVLEDQGPSPGPGPVLRAIPLAGTRRWSTPGPSGRNKGPPGLRIGRSGLVGGTPAEARHLRRRALGWVTGTIHRECRCDGQGKPFRPTTARAAYDLRAEGFRSVRALARPTLPAQPTYAGHSGGSRLGRVGRAAWSCGPAEAALRRRTSPGAGEDRRKPVL